MRLFLVRHGQTHANVARQLDTAVPGLDLTDEGREQARALADRLGGEDLGAIYTSDLVRTQQTAAPLAEMLGLEMVVLPGLREIQAGDWEMSTDWQPYIDAVVRWRDDPEHAIPGGDSGAGFMQRYDEAIARIAVRRPRVRGRRQPRGGDAGLVQRVARSTGRLLRRAPPRQHARRHDGRRPRRRVAPARVG